jgi:uncharacterized membrane protein
MIATQHIHPMLVHFPIVFFMTLAAVDLIGALRGANVTGRGAWGTVSTWLAVLAGASAVASWIFGGIALDYAEKGGFHSDIAETHEGLGTTTAIIFAVWALIRVFGWWRDMRGGRGLQAVVAILEIAGALLVIVTAYYGGQLVYDLGVNVMRPAGG